MGGSTLKSRALLLPKEVTFPNPEDTVLSSVSSYNRKVSGKLKYLYEAPFHSLLDCAHAGGRGLARAPLVRIVRKLFPYNRASVRIWGANNG